MKVFPRVAALLLCLSVPGLAGAQHLDGAARGGYTIDPAAATGATKDFSRFSSLDSAIEHYRELAQDYYWPSIARTAVLRPGDTHPVLVDIRTRLILLGDLRFSPADAQSWRFDTRLVQALERFQRRHGLSADGIWGPKSRAALNIAPQTRYQQLLLNRDRQQQFRQQLDAEQTYVQVNIPAFEMRYFEVGEQVLRMRAIVGKLEARTPLVASRIDSLETNPDWNVPSGIAYRDILPDMEASPDALQHKGIELVVGFGASMQSLPVSELDYERLYRGPQPQQRFWQAPGPNNPLGQLKFNFPNDYLVYMHGTPSGQLFDKPVRNFSSGCIRIEYPDQLARRLFGLVGAKGVARLARVESAVVRGENRVVSLPRPVAVYTTYWTAWLDDNGQIQFRDDIYQRDEEALLRLSQAPEAEPQH